MSMVFCFALYILFCVRTGRGIEEEAFLKYEPVPVYYPNNNKTYVTFNAISSGVSDLFFESTFTVLKRKKVLFIFWNYFQL